MIHRLDRCESTNDVLRALAGDGAPHGTVVVSESQEGGRGRQGRSWHSPPGENLYLSLLQRPSRPPVAPGAVNLVAAVAICEAMTPWGISGDIRWPNDVLVGGRKIAGVLAEVVGAGAYVIGVGLNCNARRFPGELETMATSMALVRGEDVDREALLDGLLERLSGRLGRFWDDGLETQRADWMGRWRDAGQRLRSEDGVEGLARGINGAGALLIEVDGGDTREIFAGDVRRLRPV